MLKAIWFKTIAKLTITELAHDIQITYKFDMHYCRV